MPLKTTAPDPLEHQLSHLPLARITGSTENPRLTVEKEAFAELRKSIALNGLLQPIAVRPRGDGYEIIGGHRRFAAVSDLAREHPEDPRFATIAASIKHTDDAHARVLRLVENVNRADLTPLETAEGIASAIASGWTTETLAAQLGWQERKLYRYRQLHAAPAWLRELVVEVKLQRKPADGDDTPSQVDTYPGLRFTDAIELIALYNALHERDVALLQKKGANHAPQAERTVIALAAVIASQGWNQDQVRAAVKKAKEPPASRAAKKEAAATKPAWTLTDDALRVDLKRIGTLTDSERVQLASRLAALMKRLGFAVTPKADPR